jgi:excisionase family DNA binding protein
VTRISPSSASLTIQQAAELLGVTGTIIDEQVDEGNLPYRMTETNHRIMLPDLVTYKRTMDRKPVESLDELVAEAQKLHLEY